MLKVFSTNRQIRYFNLKFLKEDSLIPKSISISEFKKKALIVPNRSLIDGYARSILLRDASKFSEFKTLKIGDDFFAFLENSEYILKFYQELSSEMVAIEKIQTVDTYTNYATHLKILLLLKKRYKKLLDENMLYDEIFIPEISILNSDYIKSFTKVELFLSGYMTNFEFFIFDKISNIVPLYIHFLVDRFNDKMINKFRGFNIFLKKNRKYEINFSKKIILKELDNSKNRNTKIELFSTSSRVEQIAFVKKKYMTLQKVA